MIAWTLKMVSIFRYIYILEFGFASAHQISTFSHKKSFDQKIFLLDLRTASNTNVEQCSANTDRYAENIQIETVTSSRIASDCENSIWLDIIVFTCVHCTLKCMCVLLLCMCAHQWNFESSGRFSVLLVFVQEKCCNFAILINLNNKLYVIEISNFCVESCFKTFSLACPFAPTWIEMVFHLYCFSLSLNPIPCVHRYGFGGWTQSVGLYAHQM